MKHRKRLASQRGAVLLFALLVIVVGATVLGGIAQLAVTQALAGRTEWDAAARRVQLENSRALARQYILVQMWRGYGALPAGSLGNAVTGGRGGFGITSVEPEFGYWLSLSAAGTDRINPFNLFERGGFQSAWASGYLRTRSDDAAPTDTNSANWGFQIRTRSPIVAGFAFVNQRNAANAWAPAQRIDMRQTNYAVGFSELPRMPVSSVTNTSVASSALTMENLGFMSVPKAEARFGYVLDTNVAGLFPDPAAQALRVDLGSFNYDGNPAADDNRFLEISNFVTSGTNTAPLVEVILTGSPDTISTPVQIFIPPTTTNLTTIRLRGNNKRFVYVYRHGTNEITIATAGGNLEWDFGATLECDTRLDIAGQLQITGGIRTSKQLTQVSANAPSFVAEGAATWNKDAIADRIMWVEDQRAR